MKHLLILGAGTAGTMIANRMVKKLPHKEWQITVVDPDATHLYQPGLLFLPFGNHDEAELVRARATTLDDRVHWNRQSVVEIDTQARSVGLDDTTRLPYDLLVVASGSRIRPDLTEGLLGDAWQRSIFDFYTLDGAVKLRDAFAQFRVGRVVINLVELPIKCPVAPLEFAFLADEFFEKQGIRGDVELTYVTPLDGAFTKPIASARLDHLLAEKKVKVVTEFSTGSVTDHDLVSYDERRVPFDLLVTIPTHSGANFVERSGLGNELAFIPTDHHSLAAKGLDNVFVVGDATDVPASKAGSVAHFEAETLIENLERAAAGRELVSTFDGHANLFGVSMQYRF